MRVPLTVGDFLERAATVYGDRVAVVDEPGRPGDLGTITYTSLRNRARNLAATLDRMGVGQGERVAIVSPNAARFLISFFGVSGFGRVLVPINFRLNAEEVAYIVEHSGSSVLLVDPELDESLAGVTAKERILLDGSADARQRGSPTRMRPPASTTRRARRRARRACRSPTATPGSTPPRSAGTPA
jgi:fatty-acyl-CoA synthase